MAFPRFYFLSNDELLEILAQANMQPFVMCCCQSAAWVAAVPNDPTADPTMDPTADVLLPPLLTPLLTLPLTPCYKVIN